MKKLLISTAVAMALAVISLPSMAAKVGDPCRPKGGGAGHFVKTYITIRCQADAALRENNPDAKTNPKGADDPVRKDASPASSPLAG